jgi:hypothetical protein
MGWSRELVDYFQKTDFSFDYFSVCFGECSLFLESLLCYCYYCFARDKTFWYGQFRVQYLSEAQERVTQEA